MKDLFAEALWQFHKAGRATLLLERDDGLLSPEDVGWYFTTPREFPVYEKRALKFAHASVLDVGCGAGRHSLYLQSRGLHVTAIDMSPRIAELAKARGVKDVRVANACRKLPFRDGEFDTAILFGNNLGICGTPHGLQRMLRELRRITTPHARILATTRMPSTTNPLHCSYLKRNLERGRALGQIHIRLLFNGKCGAWFDLLLISPTELLPIAAQAGWDLAHVFARGNFEEGYAVVMEKA